MEVLGNGSPIKDGENQTSAGNYTCRLPRDLNIGNSSVARNKGEIDVKLLVACKAQLSSEVIRLKTDSVRLQKERDAAHIQMKELDQVVGKFRDRTQELENRLSAAEEENKRLRNKISNSSNLCALKKPFDDFHSYPWPDNQNKQSVTSSCSDVKTSSPPLEDWKQVSQNLLEKMKQEMKELQELNSNLSLQEREDGHASEVVHETSDVKICEDKVEENLFSLIAETESLKHCLLQQRKALKSLINDVLLGNIQLLPKEISKDELKSNKMIPVSVDQSVTTLKPKSSVIQHSKLSDDSFRAFFTKHLEGCRNVDKVSKTMQLFMQPESQNASYSSKCASKVTSPKTSKPKLEPDKQNNSSKQVPEDDRVCPICQASFHESIPQNEFEEHVVDHLEVESKSLLDQYVIL